VPGANLYSVRRKALKLPHELLRARNSSCGRRKESVIPEPVTPTPLLAVLHDESVIVKLLFLWLGPQGVASYSQREVARALGISQGAVSLSLARLRELELGGDNEKPRWISSGLLNSEPAMPALTEKLLEENQTTKLIYLYLKPYSKVEVSIRQLEALLGISHRPTAEAMQRLVELGLLKVLEQPGNRPGRYRIG
jgi:transcriptional regulator with XRE-family HTH domain